MLTINPLLHYDITSMFPPSFPAYDEPSEEGVDCTDGRPEGMDDEQYCTFDIDAIKNNCNADNEYGYYEGTPCVLLKLNKVLKCDNKMSTDSCDKITQT